jgi:predicted peptidase
MKNISSILALFTLSSLASLYAKDKTGGFEISQYKGMEYQFFEPQNLKAEKEVPLIIGLHGRGKRTVDIKDILDAFHVIPSQPDIQKKYPCYILAPKATISWYPEKIVDPELTAEQIAAFPPVWKSEYKNIIELIRNPPENGFGQQGVLFELIDKLIAENNIDTNRIYIVGFSMGGTGTLQALATRPRFFAAAITAAGGGLFPWQWNEDLLSIPIWTFQGDKDKPMRAARNEAIFEFMKKDKGNMKYTVFKGAGHSIRQFIFTTSGELDDTHKYTTEFSSNNCDPESNVWDWLFKQKKTE